jgi:hypothetical protein
MPESINGRLEAFSEAGTQGVVWSLTNPILPGHYGLFPLHNNDQLAIFDDAGRPLFQGTIDLEYVGNHVHGLQRHIDPEMWAEWFFKRHRATLQQNQASVHQTLAWRQRFQGSADQLQADSYRKFNLSDGEADDLFCACQRWWINWYGQRVDADTEDGMHAKLHFTEAKALRILGSPNAEEVRAWQLRDNTPIQHPTFFRMVMLCGIGGRLEVLFGDDEVRMNAWLDQQLVVIRWDYEPRPMRTCFFSLTGLRRLLHVLREIVDQPPYGFGRD